MRALVSILAGLTVFVALMGTWTSYGPIWQAETRVRTQLASADFFSGFSEVKVNRATGSACGYVDAGHAAATSGLSGRTHFVLLPDGRVRFDPHGSVTGSTLQQLQALEKNAEYLALVYARCA